MREPAGGGREKVRCLRTSERQFSQTNRLQLVVGRFDRGRPGPEPAGWTGCGGALTAPSPPLNPPETWRRDASLRSYSHRSRVTGEHLVACHATTPANTPFHFHRIRIGELSPDRPPPDLDVSSSTSASGACASWKKKKVVPADRWHVARRSDFSVVVESSVTRG